MDCANITESNERKYLGIFHNESQCLYGTNESCMAQNASGCLFLPSGGQCYAYTEDVLPGNGGGEDYTCWTKPGNCKKG